MEDENAPWAVTDFSSGESSVAQQPRRYVPFTETLRLYAGWLLAWYCAIYALGFYADTRPLPFEIPYVRGLLYSPIILSFSFAAFLYLLLNTIHRALHGGWVRAICLMIVGAVAFGLFRMNTV